MPLSGRAARLLATTVLLCVVLALGAMMMRQPKPSPITIRGAHSLVVTEGPLPTLPVVTPGRRHSWR